LAVIWHPARAVSRRLDKPGTWFLLPHPRRNPRSWYPKTIHTEMDEFSTEFSKCADEILSLQDGRSQSCRIAMATMSPRFRRAGNKFTNCHIHAALASTMVA
jgi:hypothetical protein